MEQKDIKEFVKARYGKIAIQGTSCCGPASSCCGSADLAKDISRKIDAPMKN